jgi:hypothetical protein
LEAHLGVRRHPSLGPVVAIGSGGVFVEDLSDTALLFPPFGDAEVTAALEPLAAGRALASGRADPSLAAGLRALARAVGDMARTEPALAELDLNPVLVSAAGARIVDVRVRLVDPVPED